MPRPKVYEDRITYGVRLSKDLHKRLSAVADDRDTSINQLIVKGVESYLDRLVPLDEALRTQ